MLLQFQQLSGDAQTMMGSVKSLTDALYYTDAPSDKNTVVGAAELWRLARRARGRRTSPFGRRAAQLTAGAAQLSTGASSSPERRPDAALRRKQNSP